MTQEELQVFNLVCEQAEAQGKLREFYQRLHAIVCREQINEPGCNLVHAVHISTFEQWERAFSEITK